jgi:hypothetical protein
MMDDDTQLTIFFIAMSHSYSECLPVRLSAAMWDTLGWGIYS